MSRVLIAEGEERIASFLERGLRANGSTEVAADGERAPVPARSRCFVTKPFRFQQLLARVRVRLRAERAPEEERAP